MQQKPITNWDSRNQQGQTFLSAAIENKNFPLAEKILQQNQNNHAMLFSIDNYGRNSIWYAARHGNLKILSSLIKIAKDIPAS